MVQGYVPPSRLPNLIPDLFERLGGSRPPLVKGRLHSVKTPGVSLTFQYNPSSVKDLPSIGAWSEQSRPDEKPVVEFEGMTNRRVLFTLRLDGYPDRIVEPAITRLKALAGRRAKGKPPHEIAFDYGPVGRGATWVIQELEPLDGELRNSRLQVIQQDFSVVLLEFTDAEIALTPVERHRKKGSDDKDGGGGKGHDRHRIYVVKKGDTLQSIAQRLFGDRRRWKEIAKLNGIRDPDRLEPGQRLKIPEG